MNRPYRTALVFSGFSAVTALLVTARETMAVFSGREEALWMLFGTWCLWLGAGLWLADRWFTKGEPAPTIAKLLSLEAVLLPVLLILTRWIISPLSSQPWEIIGPGMVFFSVVIVSSCILPLGAALALLMSSQKARDSYLMVLLGGLLGGLLYSIWLSGHYNPVDIMFLCSLVLLASGGLIMSDVEGHAGLMRTTIGLFLVFGILFSFGLGANLDGSTKRMGWEDLEVIQTLDTPGGRLAVVHQGDMFSFYVNGMPHIESYDALAAEEVAHYALIQSDDPGTLLLIGGGTGGSLREILRHPVDEVDYVEVDPQLVQVSKRFILKSDEDALKDPRVKTLQDDARHHVKTTDRRYDVVIVDLPLPYNVQLNRFYTLELFQELKDITHPGGVISINLPSSDDPSPEAAAFMRDIYRTFSSVFPETLIIPGERTFFLASPSPGVLTENVFVLELRRERRWVDTRFVNRYLLREEFDAGGDLAETLEGDYRKNMDFHPIHLYYNAVLWPGTGGVSGGLYSLLLGLDLVYLTAILVFLLVGYIVWKKDTDPVFIGGASTGFSAMVVLISVSYYLQVFYGDLFTRMGPIVTSLVLGLVIGSLDMRRGIGRLKDVNLEFVKVLVYMGVLVLLLPKSVSYLEGYLYDGRVQLAFLGLPLVAGYITGLMIPLGVHLVPGNTIRVLASILAGAFIGSVLVSFFLMPVYSLSEILVLPAASSFVIAGFAFLKKKQGD